MDEKPRKNEEKMGIKYQEDEMVLPWVNRIGYGVGHVFNDLCSALWFLYFLLFLGDIDRMSGQLGAVTLLIGQIADAIATPVIGVWSDRGNLGCISRIGKRRSWYLIGNIAVVVTIPFMFSPPLGIISIPNEWLPFYLAVFVIIFQFGWAAVQTVHLALATDLTPLESERTLLLSLRNTFTSICTLAVPCIFLIIQKLTPGCEEQFMPKDAYKFQILVGVVVAIGVSCSLFSGFTMKETSDDHLDNERLAPETNRQTERRSYGQIFRQLDLYKVALLYTGTRLFGNILQTFVNLYISKTLRLPQDAVASIPLSVYTAATISSIIAERMISLIGRKATYFCGMIPGVCASIWMHIGPLSLDPSFFAYGVCSLYGAASSILLVTAISQTTVFIGMDIGNGAFVFGLMSFCDKLFCGLAILVIQSVKPRGDSSFYKDALAYTCGASAIVGMLAILTIFLPSRTGASNASETASNPDAVDS
uniref:Major facilitator superfamily domain-containing protein 12 n=2 Tax=Lygus hesperus TaxID=30085 RepID=A0A146M891_LYGHE